MATALNQVLAEPPVPPKPIPFRPTPIAQRPRRHWKRWALLAALAVASAVGEELWRIQVANAIGYDTVPVERGPIQASVTASGTLNAVVDVQVGSQVSGNIKALYADFNTKVKKGQLVGVGVSALISRLAGWTTAVGPGAVALSVFFSALVGISFGYYPARKAAYLDPIEALRSE